MDSNPTTKQQTSLGGGGGADGPKPELNLGRKRAEEWVASTSTTADNGIGGGGGETPSAGGGGGGDVRMGNDRTLAASPEAGRRSGARSRGGEVDMAMGEDEEERRAEARRQRKLVHGLTDFQPPEGW